MTSDTQNILKLDHNLLQKIAFRNYRSSIISIKKTLLSYSLFKIGFSFLLLMELLLCLYFIVISEKLSFFALFLGLFVLTAFSFFILLYYNKEKKFQRLTSIIDRFITSCREKTRIPKNSVEHHLFVANSAIKLTNYLEDFEYEVFELPLITKPIEILNYYLHKEDVFTIKELLISKAIDAHIDQIQSTPTDLEIH